jgi:hypothetical protein
VLGLAVSPLADAGKKTFRPRGAKLTFSLPARWHSTKPDRGWSFEAIAPHFDVFVFLGARPALVNDTAFLGSFVTFQRERSRSLGPHVIFRAKRITVGSVRFLDSP